MNFEDLLKYLKDPRPIDYNYGEGLFFLRRPNEDAYDCSFSFKISGEDARKLIDEIKPE